jgi:hypothetical protein
MLDLLNKVERAEQKLARMFPAPASKPAPTGDADGLEARGWRAWLTTLFPFAFEEDFSADHVRFWDLYWSVLLRIREQKKYAALGLPHPPQFNIGEDEYNILLILGRGLGKSQTIEASAVMRGALLDGGYCLYICEAQDQAEEHIGNCRDLIENPDSRLTEFYPGMRPGVRAHRVQRKSKWSEDLFVTENGWICRAKGLNSKLRGLRIGNRRPDDIKVDDIDGVNDSIALAIKKLRQLTASVFPVQAREHSTIHFGQNLITEHSVMNQIYTGKSDALGARTTIGPTSTFEQFEFEPYLRADGRTGTRILPSSIPTWPGVDISRAQKFLNDSGLATFLAEYQNQFEHLKEGRVLRNYDDARMVITKGMFAAKFGAPKPGEHFVPDYWWKYDAHDFSRTKNAYHACVNLKVTCSGKNTPLPGKMFFFDMMSFPEGTLFDEIARRILESITTTVPGTGRTWKEFIASSFSRAGLEEYQADTTKLIEMRRAALSRVLPPIVTQLLAKKGYKKWRGSNEQNKDGLKVYRDAFGIPFNPANPGATEGLDWLDHYMQVDHTTEHPFLADEWDAEAGHWRLGCPGTFLVVDDDKYAYPRDVEPDKLHDSDLCRYQFNNWRMRPAVLNDAGFIEYGPMKMNDDFGQAAQMLFMDNCVQAAPLTKDEMVLELLPEQVKPAAIAAEKDPAEKAKLLSAQVAQRMHISKQVATPRPRGGLDAWRNMGKDKRR